MSKKEMFDLLYPRVRRTILFVVRVAVLFVYVGILVYNPRLVDITLITIVVLSMSLAYMIWQPIVLYNLLFSCNVLMLPIEGRKFRELGFESAKDALRYVLTKCVIRCNLLLYIIRMLRHYSLMFIHFTLGVRLNKSVPQRSFYYIDDRIRQVLGAIVYVLNTEYDDKIPESIIYFDIGRITNILFDDEKYNRWWDSFTEFMAQYDS